MAVGLGFSVSDICTSLKIIKDSVGALDNTRGATADYSQLVTEIESLQDGLEAVQDLQESNCLPAKQNAALDRAIGDCQKHVQDFLSSISKYQPHLQGDASGLQSKFRKIRWAICKKEDVASFRDRLARQSSSISMLVIAFQAKKQLDASDMTITGSTVARHDPAHRSHVVDMLSTLSLEQSQCFMAVMKQNQELMRTTQDLRSMLQMQMSIPSQVYLQQPIVLLDPFGRIAPFHLDFVDSKECFLAVMKARFAHGGVTSTGLVKLDRQEFLVENTKRKTPVDLTRKWENLWKPGEQYDMKMVFHRFTCQSSPPNTCPKCNELNEEDDDQIQCYVCGLQYQKLQAISKQSKEWGRHFPKDAMVDICQEEIPYLLRHPSRKAELKVFRPSTEYEDESFEGYRRIQVVSQSLGLLNERYPAHILIEDFVRFAELVIDLPSGISVYQDQIKHLQTRASHFISEQQNRLPPFSSFSQIEQTRKNLADISLRLRQDIDSLVRKLCEDSETRNLMNHVQQKAPKHQIAGYYTGVLIKMASLSDFAATGGNKSPKSVSQERMQWLLLDSRPTSNSRH